ncbi:MAG: CsbD family protein [Rhizobacter sp.]|nr:CsbD family protein [Bacteriovorax sp.]
MNTQDSNSKNNFAVNEDTIKGKWKEVKGDVQKMWGKLTDDELDQAQGDLTSLSGIIQRRYGESKEAVDTKLNDYFSTTWKNVKTEIAKGAEKAKEAVAAATENSKQKL